MQLPALAPEKNARLAVQPLACPKCGGLVPLTDASVAPCPYCGTQVEVPPEHRALRAAARRSEHDRALAEQAYRNLGAPPGPLLTLWAGAAGGFAHVLFVFATGLLKVWGWLLLNFIDALKSIDDARILLVILALPLLPLVALFWVTGSGLHALAMPLGYDPLDTLGPGLAFGLVGAALYLLMALPTAVHTYGESFSKVRRRLQASMAARPPSTPGGPALCRNCAAPLAVSPGELGARCDYCHADNLVALPAKWVTNVRTTEQQQHTDCAAALAEQNAVRADARGHMVATLLYSLAVIPAFVVGGLATCHFGVLPGAEGWSASIRAGDRVQIFQADGSLQNRAHMLQSVNHELADERGRVRFDVALERGERITFIGRVEGSPTNAGDFAMGQVAHSSSDSDRTPSDMFKLTVLGRDTPLTWTPTSDGASEASFVAPYSGWFQLSALTGRKQGYAPLRDILSLGWKMDRASANDSRR